MVPNPAWWLIEGCYMSKRYEYTLLLQDFVSSTASRVDEPLEFRPVQVADASAIADLMIDSYRGTIDDDGETLEDALAEVQAYLAGKRGGQPWLVISCLAFVDDRLVGACLLAEWSERQLPIIAYLIVRAEWKQRGIGRQILSRVLKALKEKGFPEVRAVITEGNEPSENLFHQLGFRKL
jgi:L-amino acid N-acyltransferase YncA